VAESPFALQTGRRPRLLSPSKKVRDLVAMSSEVLQDWAKEQSPPLRVAYLDLVTLQPDLAAGGL
jgi:hypothetical protein